MKRILIAIVIFLFFLTVSIRPMFAIENPIDSPNNKVGIHILFTHELPKAASLVNSNGGEWGYVTIPIQVGDKDIEKWQGFMDEAKKLKVIPLIRISTEGDYFNTKVWRKPTEEDVLDFANFLHSLEWPTKNRYVIVFNETNRGNEWGGAVNPEEYAKLLSYAVSAFKSKNSDFFMISGGLDNAAPTQGSLYMDSYEYLRRMDLAVPGIFYQIDGLGSHSYPNPAFAKPPQQEDSESVATFRFEKQLIESLGGKNLPVFITETGWSFEKVSPSVASQYYAYAFEHAWSDSSVIAVTPFLLSAGAGPFTPFSFVDGGGNPNQNFEAIKKLPKIAGSPKLSLPQTHKKVLAAAYSVKMFESEPIPGRKPRKEYLYPLFEWFLKL